MSTTEKAPKRKVLASTGGALTGAVAADFTNWCVNEWFFAPSESPSPVSAFVTGVTIGAFAFFAGYMTPSAPQE